MSRDPRGSSVPSLASMACTGSSSSVLACARTDADPSRACHRRSSALASALQRARCLARARAAWRKNVGRSSGYVPHLRAVARRKARPGSAASPRGPARRASAPTCLTQTGGRQAPPARPRSGAASAPTGAAGAGVAALLPGTHCPAHRIQGTTAQLSDGSWRFAVS